MPTNNLVARLGFNKAAPRKKYWQMDCHNPEMNYNSLQQLTHAGAA